MHLAQRFLGNAPGKTPKVKSAKERFFLIELAGKYF
jgi:hypothetical protein